MRILALTVLLFWGASTSWGAAVERADPTKQLSAKGPQRTRGLEIERERLELERERLKHDVMLREKELALKNLEMAAKAAEQRASAWSPLLVAVIAAALALFGNVLVTYLQGKANQRIAQDRAVADLDLANQKATFDEKLEHDRAQSNLILEAIRTGDSIKASKNLLFFVELGLLDDPGSKILTWLRNHESPSLPPPSGTLASAMFDIEIIVLDAGTETPIQNAQVLTSPVYFVQFSTLGRTNERGVLTAQFPLGRYFVRVLAEGYVDDVPVIFEVPPFTERVVKLTRR